jgi:hypothetical protein
MSENYKRLDAVWQKIEDLLRKKTKLKKKQEKGQLTDEEIVLEGVAKLLAIFEKDKDRWFKLVEEENKPEETSKSFREADAEWIASVTMASQLTGQNIEKSLLQSN